MTSPAPCAECQALREELGSAFAGLAASPNLRDELQAASDAVSRMLGGTEEDAQRAEEAIAKVQSRSKPDQKLDALHAAFQRMVRHCFRTGHRVLFRP